MSESPIDVEVEGMPPLATPSDLTGFPGAPFSAAVVASGSGAIRDEAGWHIAPKVAQTFTLDAKGGSLLMLPTLKLVAVLEVRDVSDPDNPVILTGYRKTRSGMLERTNGGCWPRGFETIEADVIHGYDTCPPSLLPVLVERAQYAAINGAIKQEVTIGQSVTYGTLNVSGSVDSRVAKFQLRGRVD